jgi:hypothetical protein
VAKKTKDKQKVPTEGMASNGSADRPGAKKPVSRRKKAISPKPSTAKKAKAHVSDEAIRTRAYFISEQRKRKGIPGDANSDWIEARRQLLAELGES